MPRIYTHIHDQLLVNFLQEYFPTGNYIIYPRVGAIREEFLKGLTEAEKKAMSPWKLRPDAFAWDEQKFYIIELIVRPNEWWKYAKLLEYEEAFKKDPNYKAFWERPIEKWLVATEENEFARRRCEAVGVKFIKFKPSWTAPYIASLPKRTQRPFGQVLE